MVIWITFMRNSKDKYGDLRQRRAPSGAEGTFSIFKSIVSRPQSLISRLNYYICSITYENPL